MSNQRAAKRRQERAQKKGRPESAFDDGYPRERKVLVTISEPSPNAVNINVQESGCEDMVAIAGVLDMGKAHVFSGLFNRPQPTPEPAIIPASSDVLNQLKGPQA